MPTDRCKDRQLCELWGWRYRQISSVMVQTYTCLICTNMFSVYSMLRMYDTYVCL